MKKIKIFLSSLVLVIFFSPGCNFDVKVGNPNEFVKESKIVDYYAEGIVHYRQGDYEKAIKMYDEALEIDENYYKAWYGKAKCYYELGRYNETLAASDKALEINPNCISCWEIRRDALAETNDINKSISSINRALEEDPDSEKLLNDKGYMIELSGDYEKALGFYKKVLEVNPKNSHAWNNQVMNLKINKPDINFMEYDISSYSVKAKTPLWWMASIEGGYSSEEYPILFKVIFTRNKTLHPSIWLLLIETTNEKKYLQDISKIKTYLGQGRAIEKLEKSRKTINNREAVIFNIQSKKLDQERHTIELQGINAYISCGNNKIFLIVATASADEYPSLEDTFTYVINSIEC